MNLFLHKAQSKIIHRFPLPKIGISRNGYVASLIVNDPLRGFSRVKHNLRLSKFLIPCPFPRVVHSVDQ